MWQKEHLLVLIGRGAITLDLISIMRVNFSDRLLIDILY